MKKSLELSDLEIADLCRELALLMRAGVRTGDGLMLLAEEEKDEALRAMLEKMAKCVDEGAFLSQALKEAGCFPGYITGLLRIGEEVGKSEETLDSLAVYYEGRDRMTRQVISSLTYPAILLLLMMVVIIILLSRVLPVFNDIYSSLGGQLTGVAGGLLLVGQFLDRVMPGLCVLLALAAIFLAVIFLHRDFRNKVLGVWRKHWGDRGISRKMNNAHFSQALAMGVSSGMPLEEAIDLAIDLLKDQPGAVERCKKCRDRLQQGVELAAALGENDLLSPSACRLLSLGMREGDDEVLSEISRRMQDDAQQALEDAVSKVEPALVLVTSFLVGVILLSVMLPLMNIMTAIG